MKGKVTNKDERENSLLRPHGALGTACTPVSCRSRLLSLTRKVRVLYCPGVCIYLHVPQHPV